MCVCVRSSCTQFSEQGSGHEKTPCVCGGQVKTHTHIQTRVVIQAFICEVFRLWVNMRGRGEQSGSAVISWAPPSFSCNGHMLTNEEREKKKKWMRLSVLIRGSLLLIHVCQVCQSCGDLHKFCIYFFYLNANVGYYAYVKGSVHSNHISI